MTEKPTGDLLGRNVGVHIVQERGATYRDFTLLRLSWSIKKMAPEEALFNATIVLIPIWLGVARYIISETTFESTVAANTVGLGMVLILLGILFPMWISVQQLITKSEDLFTGLITLFFTLSLMGLGSVLFIIKEINPISGFIVTGIPTGIALIGLAFFAGNFTGGFLDVSVAAFIRTLINLTIASMASIFFVDLYSRLYDKILGDKVREYLSEDDE